MNKCVVLISGGLDSRLAVKLMKAKGFNVTCVYFKLPFSKDSENEIKDFCKKERVDLNVIDCTKDSLLKEYLEVIKNPQYKRGAGFNPCIDCKIFLLKKTKEFADKKNIKFIVTGEIVGQRPMSQTGRALKIIENDSRLAGRILRPLSELGIQGRKRTKQIELAEKFKISYPSPAGGCLLCERELKKRFEFLVNRGLKTHELKLLNIGRHFLMDDFWIVTGRNESENKIIEGVSDRVFNKKNLIVPDFPGPSAIILPKNLNKKLKINKTIKQKTEELIKSYSKKGNLERRKEFEIYKI